MARLSRLTFPKVQLLGLAEALKSFFGREIWRGGHPRIASANMHLQDESLNLGDFHLYLDAVRA
jgi:hypothetical protein